MQLPSLPPDWMPTRASLQAYAQAVTAFPRAGAAQDPRWSHVAMDPHPVGFVTWPTPLADGSELVTVLDLERHVVTASAGDDVIDIDLTSGPSSRSVGDALMGLATSHGLDADVDVERFGSSESRSYDTAHAEAFLGASRAAVAALESVHDPLGGEVAGPHLWPHGFDVAAEWFSERMVPYGDGEASAQIAMGWYPSEESYVYVNPWPFRAEYEEIPLPAGAAWHRDGWDGAQLFVPAVGVDTATVAELGSTVHEATRDSLGA